MAEPEQAEFAVAQRLNAAKLKQSVDGAPEQRRRRLLGGFTSPRLRFVVIGCR
jgi:hypothetical protein